MRASDEQKAGVVGWVEKWRPRLFLDRHTIETRFRSRPDHSDEDGRITRASCTQHDAGLTISVDVFPALWTESPEIQERQIVHELLHAVSWSSNETEINHLTEIVWHAYERRSP